MIPVKADSHWCELNISEIAQLNPLCERKRYIERFQLKRFIQKFAEFPVGDREWQGERPDLIVKTVSGRLGVEHTTLYTDDPTNGSLRKQQESLQWKLVESALVLYAGYRLPAVSVEVWFDAAVPLKKTTYSGVATALAQAVRSIVLRPGCGHIEDMTRREYERRFADPLPPEIPQIQLSREQRTEYVVWYAQQPWVISELKVLNIQATIKAKELHLFEYRKKCDELWLLIASEGLYPSSNFASSEELSAHAFQTRFDRVFYLDGFRGDIVELKRAS